MPAASKLTGALRPVELATASVMTAAAVGVILITSVVPQIGTLGLLAAVPYGIVGQRHRLRAVVAAVLGGLLLTFLLVGTGAALNLIIYAVVGGVVGQVKRRRRGLPTLVVASMVLAVLAGAGADLVLLVFASYRRLVFETILATEAGLKRSLENIPVTRGTAGSLDRITRSFLNNWPVSVGLTVSVVTIFSMLVTWRLVGTVLDRLQWITENDLIFSIPLLPLDRSDLMPLPVTLTNVSLRYPGVCSDALDRVNLEIPCGQFIVVVGDNGSGKSTLARILVGAPPTSGSVQRAGRVGLGAPGGTALIMQRPDAQVLGARVADDVVWGLPDGHKVDVEGLLAIVGLAGIGEQSTASLSGGQLQRLSVAAAIARKPRLLISDESTAMVDPDGRRELVNLFAALPGMSSGWPMSVVHITHSDEEAAQADRVLTMAHGRILDDRLAASPARLTTTIRDREPSPVDATAPSLLTVSEVGHTYRRATPWAHTALREINLSVPAGDGIVIVGNNGSGKSTLAWIMAGLLKPSSGSCLIAGRPTHQSAGTVGLAFQHARLQLQRPTVAADIADAAGWSAIAEQRDQIELALHRVGLAGSIATRSIDQLSGGEMRRVAIAGLLAREPRVLVLDEPLAGLDRPSRIGLLDLLASLRETAGMTLAVVSHDTAELTSVCPRVIELTEGRITRDSRADLLPTVTESC